MLLRALDQVEGEVACPPVLPQGRRRDIDGVCDFFLSHGGKLTRLGKPGWIKIASDRARRWCPPRCADYSELLGLIPHRRY